MNNIVRFSASNMKRDEETLQKQIEQIPKFIDDLETAMHRLGTCWDGPAWLSFQQEVDMDIQMMTGIYGWMHQYVQSMAGALEEYGKAESQSRELVERIKI